MAKDRLYIRDAASPERRACQTVLAALLQVGGWEQRGVEESAQGGRGRGGFYTTFCEHAYPLLISPPPRLHRRQGLLPLIGIGLIILNFVLVSIFPDGFLIETNLFLHLGIIVALIGQMLAWAL